MEKVFRTPLNYEIFKTKYSHDGCETWEDLSRTLVNQVCGPEGADLPKDVKDGIYEIIRDMKFIPGGRYLYYAGRKVKFYNNCFSGTTGIVTNHGLLPMKEVFRLQESGRRVEILSPVDGRFKNAKMHKHGVQDVYRLVFAPLRGRSKITYEVEATEDHKWALIDGGQTTNLSIGDVVPANKYYAGRDDVGFLHGFMFGDGNRHGQLRLCSDKDQQYVAFFQCMNQVTITYPEFADGDPVIYASHKIDWKKLPENKNPAYIASFIEGWIAADGSDDRMLCSVDKEALEWFRKNAIHAGIVISGELREQVRDVNIGEYYYQNHSIFIQNFSRGEKWNGFKLIEKEWIGEEEVYCPFEPEYNRIVIDHGIDTFNCYLLRAEEDTREDWADLSWKSESCLITGGGIGIDYSVYRPSGATISRTGGTASGPVPKMLMVNEIGRRVMQGGSRRSAIYASLNWQHGDIPSFLTVKDWHKMPIAGTEKTYWDVKNLDWNFPAPLDMTNISVNYDTAWLMNYYKTGDVGDVFKKNVEQALATGEPGFSFNFFDKENETLRNAPVSADTWVLTDDGYRQIRDIIEEEVRVWTGRQYAKTVFKKTKESVNTVVVNMSGGRAIKADPDHEFLVENWTGKGKNRRLSGIIKVKAKDLQKGQILHTSYPTEPAENVWEGDTLAYWKGYAYGDGSFNKHGADITLCSEASKVCGVEMELDTFCSRFVESDARGYTRAFIKDNWFSDKSKSVYPTELSEREVSLFLAGLFDADGSYDKELNLIRLSSIHYGFLEGVRRELEELGIMSGITKAGHTTYSNRQTYSLCINRGYTKQFKELIPTIRLKIVPKKEYRKSVIKVISIQEGPIEDVYCCDVGVEEHSFMAEGVIISNCTEVTSADDSDVCNLGSVNMSRIEDIDDFANVVELATIFLLAGTIVADLPYEKVARTREKNRRLGLGLMGIHEWLIKRGERYEVTPELHQWLAVYRGVSDDTSRRWADTMGVSIPVANRAIAPTGTIGMVAGTTTGIEPVYAVAYKRRYLKNKRWHYQYEIDTAARNLIEETGCDPSKVESAIDLASDYERRIKFQADVQDYVDMAISSTINLPPRADQNFSAEEFSSVLASYASRLRGFTCYPDGSRGGQPLTSVPYEEAIKALGTEYEEHMVYNDVCDITGGGYCGT